MNVVAVPYLVCAAAHTILASVLFASRTSGRAGKLLGGACLVTGFWALCVATDGLVPASLVAVVESARNAAWLVFLCVLLMPEGEDQAVSQWTRDIRRIAAAVGALAVGIDLASLVLAPAAAGLAQPQMLARLAVAVLVLALVENYYRNVSVDDRWSVVPLAIAIGAMFTFELFFYSDVLLFRRLDRSLLAARAIADALCVPLLALAVARNAGWRTQVRMSHNAAFHAVTLISSGVFLVSVAVVGMLARKYGGQWGTILQVTSLFGSAVVLATVMSSETARSGIRLAILRNFFTYRYDYRVEWLRCIDALSASGAVADLPERVIRTLADVVNSPGGVLFQRHDHVHAPSAFWNARVPPDSREPEDGDFISRFRDGHWIQELRSPSGDVAPRPAWLDGDDSFWLAVPLPHRNELIGFVLLVEPRSPVNPDWEVFDLLRTVARQAASYLSEQRTARSLADAQTLQEYSKRFAFVVHDIKNLSSQLGLILSNARRHGSNPDFQADVLHTVENSVARMNNLLSQLKMATPTESPTEAAPETAAIADALAIVGELAATHQHGARIDVRCAGRSVVVHMDAEGLRSVLWHLINNALEASGHDGRVVVDLGVTDDRATIDIVDEGPGMEVSFMRDELFRPFRSTKKSGFGIGAYQTRELIRAAGGQLDVISKPGAGTTMHISLPRPAGKVSQVSPAA